MQKLKWPLVGAGMVIGILAGVVAASLSLFLDGVEHVMLHYHETNLHPIATGTNPWLRLLSVTLAGIIAAISWYYLQRQRKLVNINQALKQQVMPVKATILDVLTQIFYVGSGGSVGRELAPREGAVMVWQQVSRHWPRWQFDADEQRLLMATAAGAGFAGVYISPLTGMLFVVEMLYRKVTVNSVVVSLIASGIATVIGASVKGWSPYYAVVKPTWDWSQVPWVILLATLLTFVGVVFRRGITTAKAHHVTDRHILWQLPLVALLTGLVALKFPQVMGNGRGLAQLAMTTKPSLMLLGGLVVMLVAKALLTLGTLKAGAYGGVIAPSIAIGATSALMIACILMPAGWSFNPVLAGVVGATTVLSVTQRAPWMAMVMMMEICQLPLVDAIYLGMAVFVAWLMQRWFKLN